MGPKFLILNYEGIEDKILIEDLPVTIGRYPENRISLSSYDYVSGEHGKIFINNSDIFLRI